MEVNLMEVFVREVHYSYPNPSSSSKLLPQYKARMGVGLLIERINNAIDHNIFDTEYRIQNTSLSNM